MIDQLLSNFYLWVGIQPYTWFAIAVMASLADALLTIYALRLPNTREGNPVMGWFMDKLGIVGALALVKGGALAVMFYTLQESILYAPVTCVMYLVVAVWNMHTILRAKALL